MTNLLNRYATPFITGLFVASLVSGVALFAHIGTGAFRDMHEWLSIVLIVPFILHLWRNWKPMKAYFKKTAFGVAIGVSFIASIAFVIPTGGTNRPDGPPQFAFAHTIVGNSAEKIAPLFGVSADKIVEKLKAEGFNAANATDPLNLVAEKSGKDEFVLFATLNGISK
jgi:Domain of unknown function (DUF4405)